MKVRQSSVSISGKSSLSLFQNMLRLLIWNMHIIIKTVINRMHAHSNHPVLPTPLACATSIIWLNIRVAHCFYLCCFSLSPLSSFTALWLRLNSLCSSVSFVALLRLQHWARVNVVPSSLLCVLFSSCAFIFSFRFYSDKASSVPNWICICN